MRRRGLVLAGPYLTLAAVALLVHVNRDIIPERYPVHWNFRGEVDRWSGRNARDLFAPFVMGAVMVTAITGVALWLGQSPQGAAGGFARGFTPADASIIAGVGYVMAFIFSGIGVMPLVRTADGFGPGTAVVLALVPILNLAMMYWMMRTKRNR